MKVYLRTFGCQMNEQDSEVMRSRLVQEGYETTDRMENADLILFNTCSIREKASHKAMSAIGRGRQLRKEGSLLAVTGCVASQEGAALLKKAPGIDLVLGTDHIGKIAEAVREARIRKTVWSGFHEPFENEFPVPVVIPGEKKVKAYVTIMKGCDNNCTFCIVPLTRGKEFSRNPDDILLEIHRLEEQGVKEVILLGQNVNSYGKGLQPKVHFPDLLRRIEKETEISRIRFTSPHPKDFGKDLVAEYARNERLCPHVHLPVQSGSNQILKRMQRAYSRRTYLKKVEAIRQARPGVAITTDIIVGFPGETEQDFRETLSLTEEVGFDQSYSFIFSSRPGTVAARLPDDLPIEIKKERLARLQSLQELLSERIYRTRIGIEEEVLVEGSSLQGSGQLTGRTPHGRIVNFDGDPSRVGAILNVQIKEASAFALRGEWQGGKEVLC